VPPFELSFADADGREIGHYADGACSSPTSREKDPAASSLDLLLFYVTFRNGRGEVMTVCVEAT
jgi:hypothetical protein